MTAANEHLQALDAISEAIGEATRDADWARLKHLDSTARKHMEAASDAAKAGTLPVNQLIERLDKLQQLFEAARTEAVKSRDEAEAALKTTGRTHQAAQAYLNNAKK
jgi:protein involved in polysaccharide export with SLBB domain